MKRNIIKSKNFTWKINYILNMNEWYRGHTIKVIVVYEKSHRTLGVVY